MVDDFALSSEKPTLGAWHFLLTLGELPPMPITLYAATEEMKNLWYAHTAAYRKSADVRAWVNGYPHHHRYLQATSGNGRSEASALPEKYASDCRTTLS